MASVNLDFIHHHQPLPFAARHIQRRSAGQPLKHRSAAWKRGDSIVGNAHENSIAFIPNVSPSAGLQDRTLIECIDLTTPPSMESLGPVGEPALALKGTEVCAQGNSPPSSAPTGADRRFPDLSSIRPHPKASDEESDDHFPSLEEILRGAGDAQEPQRAVSGVDRGIRKADDVAERPSPIDRDDAPPAGSTRGGDIPREADARSGVRPSSGGSVSEGQGGEQGSLSNPPTSVPGPEAEYAFSNLRSLISLLI